MHDPVGVRSPTCSQIRSQLVCVRALARRDRRCLFFRRQRGPGHAAARRRGSRRGRTTCARGVEYLYTPPKGKDRKFQLSTVSTLRKIERSTPSDEDERGRERAAAACCERDRNRDRNRGRLAVLGGDRSCRGRLSPLLTPPQRLVPAMPSKTPTPPLPGTRATPSAWRA